MLLLPLELRILSQSLLQTSSILRSKSFSTSIIKLRSLESPSYPGLYYHSISKELAKSKGLNSSNSWNLSFLPTPSPSEAFSPTTIGLLAYPPPNSNNPNKKEEEEQSTPPEISPRNFEENKEFIEVMNEILQQSVLGDLGMETLARVRGDGYIHIADERNPSDPNRVPDPSDIIASILIQSNQLLKDSYSPSGTHRLVTRDGLFKLNDSLMKKLIKGLELVREVEIQVAKEEEEGLE